MTKHDEELIQQANELNCMDWDIAAEMAEQADTQQAASELKAIALELYLREEALAELS